MKLFGKHFSLGLLALCLLLLPLLIFSASATSIGGSCGENLRWSLNTSTGLLTIDGTGNMVDYSFESQNPPPWYVYRNEIKEVYIGKGVSSVGSCAFTECTSLKSVTIAGNVTEIRNSAFEYCVSLNRADLPEGLRSIGPQAFAFCESLEELRLPETVVTIEAEAFWFCTALQNISLPRNLTDLGEDAFAYCYELKQVDLPETLGSIPVRAFQECVSLESIRLPHGLSSIGSYAFSDCHSLRYMNIPNSVNTLGWGVFTSCIQLSQVILPEDLQQAGEDLFRYCDALTEVYFRGSAPTAEDLNTVLCLNSPETVTLYYTEGQEGWASPALHGYTTKLWHGVVTEDVKEKDYFYTPVQWALWNKITNGMGKDRFLPESTCTRGQIVTFLWRAAGCPEPTATENPFTDISPKAYYYKAVLWAVEKEITNGMGKNLFAPEGECTRGQVATFLWRAAGKPTPAGSYIPFGDVPANAYYTQAVLWAVENEITNGTARDKFSPDAPCTRGQIVTFLWRAAGEPGPLPKIIVPSLYASVLQSTPDYANAQESYCEGMLYDLNLDGTEELILMYTSRIENHPYGQVCDVYTIRDGQVVPLLEKHLVCYNVGGNTGKVGVLVRYGHLYFYTFSSSWDGEYYHSWELFRFTEEGFNLVTEVSYDLPTDYIWQDEHLLPASYYIENGISEELEQFRFFRDSLHTRDSINGFVAEHSDRGYSLELLLEYCK